MTNQGFIKQIKKKGDNQAVIYVDQKLMRENNLEIGDVVIINKK